MKREPMTNAEEFLVIDLCFLLTGVLMISIGMLFGFAGWLIVIGVILCTVALTRRRT